MNRRFAGASSLVLGAALVSMLVSPNGVHARQAAPAGGQTLLAHAVRNTNAARSYVDSHVESQTSGQQSIVTTGTETYDETHNREKDHTNFLLIHRASGGHVARLQYSVDVVMMNGHTFYRSSRDHQGWRVQPGMGYTDPASGQRWIRSSLKFAFPKTWALVSQGAAAGNLWHYHFRPPMQAPTKGQASVDTWVTATGTPYIVRYDQSADFTLRGVRIKVSTTSTLQGFNQPVHITAPKIGS